VQHESTSRLGRFIEESINFQNREVFIFYAVIAIVCSVLCLLNYYKHKQN